MDPPVHLQLPSPEPMPVSDCDVCMALGEQRSEARAVGDMSRVSDLNVELLSHPGRHRMRLS